MPVSFVHLSSLFSLFHETDGSSSVAEALLWLFELFACAKCALSIRLDIVLFNTSQLQLRSVIWC